MHIIGHQAVRERLGRLVALSEHPQSFLFVGPESVGKRAVAFELAWKLIGQGEQCMHRSEAECLHPDIALLEPEQVTEKGKTREKNISVEAVREQLSFLSRYPLTGKKRVLIIDNAHRLSRGAQSALLKTLEEPNATSILILVTHVPAALLDTVHSRVQHVAFSLVPEVEMEYAEPELADRFFYSLGRPGVLKTALEHPEEFAETSNFLRRFFQLEQFSCTERLRLAEDLSKEGVQALRLLQWWVPSVRQQALTAVDPNEVRRIYGFLEAWLNTARVLHETQANVRLQLEKLFLSR